MTSAPKSHLEESLLLTADAPVDLYTIILKVSGAEFPFTADRTVTWQGVEYEGIACRMSGDSQNADGEESRPLLQLMNPFGVFNTPAINGLLDYATVIRKRVLGRNVTNNVNIFEQRMWYVGRIRELVAGQGISFELRNMTEGANFQIPCRMYIPPEFPMVTL